MDCCESGSGDSMKDPRLQEMEAEEREMDRCGSVGDAMKGPILQEKEAKVDCCKSSGGDATKEEEKPKVTTLSSLFKNGKRVLSEDHYINNPKQLKISACHEQEENFDVEEEDFDVEEEEIVLKGLFDDDEEIKKIEEDGDEEIKKKFLKQLFSKKEVQDIDENDIAYYDLDEDLINMDDEDDGCGIVNNYVRGSPSSTVGIPRGEELKSKLESYANLAIDAYNEVKSKKYRFVDVVSSTGYLCQGVLYSMTFEAKLPGQDDLDALTLVAEVYEGLFGEREVCLVCKPEERPPYYPQTR